MSLVYNDRESLIVFIDWPLSRGYARYLCDEYLHRYALESDCEILDGKFSGMVMSNSSISMHS